MGRILEAKLLERFEDPEDGETKRNPRIKFRETDGKPVGSINVRGVQISCDKYTKLPEGKRGHELGKYLAGLPYVHVRSVPQPENLEEGLHPNIQVVSEADYAKELASGKVKPVDPKPKAKVDAKTAINTKK